MGDPITNGKAVTDSEDSYLLTRGWHQLVRVHLLQHLWIDTSGYQVHPKVDTNKSSPFRVADVATASGLWLCELSRLGDSTKYDLHGFDISSKSFIPSQQLPENVKLHVRDAHLSPSDEFKGQFDLVHVRLIQPAIMNGDPSWVIKHCMELLKPGGYLQWEEFDPMSINVCKAPGSGSGLQGLTDMLQNLGPLEWIGALPEHMKHSDMEVVAVERRREPDFHHGIMTYLHTLVFDEFASHMEGEKGEKVRSMVKAAYEDGLQGTHIEYMFQTVLARKV